MKNNLQPTTYYLQPNLGFTLLELLVTITLIGIIGALVSQAFILGIRSQSKSEVMKEVKQNGDYAISVIESMLRNAVDIEAVGVSDTCNVNTKSIKITNPDGLTTTFDCSGEGGRTDIASISGLPHTTPQPTPTGIPLTNDKVVVPSTSCSFRLVCPTPPLSPKYVYASFTIRQVGEDLPPESVASLDYQTTVSLRVYE